MESIRYVETNGVHLAYRVMGDGDTDIVWVPGWVWDIEASWNVPGGSVRSWTNPPVWARLIMFDTRGTGQSDRIPEGRFPSLDERRERWATFERRAASPGAFSAYSQMLGDIDVRNVLDDVTVPVLLIHSQGDRMVSVEQSRYMADRLRDARLVEIASADHLTFVSDPLPTLTDVPA